MSVQPAVLVFPIDLPQSVAFARTACELGFKVVAASSEPLDPTRHPGCTLAHLPYVTEQGFDGVLADLLRRHGIAKVFAPHPAVWAHLKSLAGGDAFPVAFSVCNESPYAMDWQPYAESYRWAETCMAVQPLMPCEPDTALSVSNYAGLHRAYNLIPGQSDDTKLCALAQIARQLAPGDVVEIGSLYGKSAFALAWLAKAHRIGTVVCIDPWDIAAIRDQGSQAGLINSAVASRDWQQAFLGFAASLAAFDNVNYVRAPSEAAAEAYRDAAAAGSMQSAEFGRTPLKGSITLLHIDGNHKYEVVKRDIESWLPFVQRGGWVLLDDYVWAFGDGPKRASDELLARHPVQTAFVAGDTLFVQF